MSEKRLPHAVLKDSIYCATASGNIIKLDISDGKPLQEFTLENTEEVKKLYATSDQKKLYAVYKESTFLIDLKTEEYQQLMFPEGSRRYLTSFVGNRLIVPSKTKLLLIDSEGQTKTIPYHPSVWSDHRIKGTDQFMVYEEHDKQTDKSVLVCLDSDTNKQLWKYPVDDLDLSNVEVSPNNDFIFVLTNRAVMAFTPNSKESGPLIWKTDLEKNYLSEINSIYLSDDSSALYGLETHQGKLYEFDIKTGKKTFLYEKEFPGTPKIVGNFDNKLYIHST